MKKNKLNQKLFNWKNSIFIILIFLAFHVGLVFSPPEIKLVEVAKIIKREVKVNNCACIPCEMEPRLEKCQFQSAVYQAVSNQVDPITGFKLLSKGEKYYLTGDEFFVDYTKFCSLNKDDKNDWDDEPRYTNDCFYIDQITNKNLFKQIN